ncbi:hypothetical protein USB125703_00271 [Pseudoclavibacter triregionum]|nr:hypothetical protein USB125703_00271 [Pseudoclavibacter triregionum]
MDTTTQTAAPLTRRQAREIERRTGVRPVALPASPQSVALAETVAQSFRDDTGEIERNAVASLVSVVPTEAIERAALAPVAELPAAFAADRGMTVRAAKPASLVAKQRRRAAAGFAAAAAAAAVASTGILVPVAQQADASAAGQANLLDAAAKSGAEATQAPAETPETRVQTVVTTIVAAPAETVDRIDTESTGSGTAVAPAPTATATATGSTASTGTSTSGSTQGASGSTQGASTGSGSGLGSAPASSSVAQAIVQGAEMQLGKSGTDCTDMVQDALAYAGIVKSRFDGGADYGVGMLMALGTPVAWSDLQPGDLIGDPRAPHIAIYIGNGQAIHGGWNGTADDTVIAGIDDYNYTAVRIG